MLLNYYLAHRIQQLIPKKLILNLQLKLSIFAACLSKIRNKPIKCDSDLTKKFIVNHMGGPWNHDDRLDEKVCLFMAPKSYMTTDLDCGADPFLVVMCRGPLMFIEKVNLFVCTSTA